MLFFHSGRLAQVLPPEALRNNQQKINQALRAYLERIINLILCERQLVLIRYTDIISSRPYMINRL